MVMAHLNYKFKSLKKVQFFLYENNFLLSQESFVHIKVLQAAILDYLCS